TRAEGSWEERMDYKTLKQQAKVMQYREEACPSCSASGVVSRQGATPCPNCDGTGRLWWNNWEEGTLSDRGLGRLIRLLARRSTAVKRQSARDTTSERRSSRKRSQSTESRGS